MQISLITIRCKDSDIYKIGRGIYRRDEKIKLLKEENKMGEFSNKKTAKQIILDLKGKLSDVDSDMLTGQDNLDLDLNASSPYLKESLEALRALGYTKTEVKRITF